VEPAERRFVVAASAAAIAVSTAPRLWGALSAPPGTRFGWGVGFLPDTLGNLIFVRQAASGSFLFADTYTAEPHPALIFHPLFLLVGWLQRLTALQPGLLLEVVRLAAAAALLHALTEAGRRLFAGGSGRRALLLLALTGGGLGFLAPAVRAFAGSADVEGAEMMTFFSLYQQPHFVLALVFLAWAVMHFADAVETGSARSARLAASFHFLLGAVHPYDIPVTATAAAAAAVFARRRPFAWRPLVLFVAAPAPLLAYNAWLSGFVPVYREFAAEGLRAPPWPVLDYVLGFALLLPLALAGLPGAARSREVRWLLPVAWLIAAPALMCLPIPARRKLMEGYHLMLCCLAARGWTGIAPRLGRWRVPAAAAGLAVMSLSPLYVLARDIYAIDLSRRPERPLIGLEAGALVFPLHRPSDRIFAPDPWIGGILSRNVDRYDLPLDLLAVLAWSAAHLDRSQVILAAPETGLLVPMFTPHRVVAGHLFETLQLADKELGIRAVMDGYLPDDARRYLLIRLGAGAILADARLARLGGWRPEHQEWLAPLFQSGDVRLFAVQPMPEPAAAHRMAIEAEAAACLTALSGKELLDRGRFDEAIMRLRQAEGQRPADGRVREWLRAAEAGRSGRPVPPGTRDTAPPRPPRPPRAGPG